VYRLHIYDGMKVGEISDFLGENYKNVEYRLGTARKAMRQYLRAI
jgi:RNA polymerase sigma-70 factor (ECF subfamily)